jgi:hypothetical protein
MSSAVERLGGAQGFVNEEGKAENVKNRLYSLMEDCVMYWRIMDCIDE